MLFYTYLIRGGNPLNIFLTVLSICFTITLFLTMFPIALPLLAEVNTVKPINKIIDKVIIMFHRRFISYTSLYLICLLWYFLLYKYHLGILVLLAGPRLLGYIEKVELARIQHDVKVVENKMAGILIRYGK